MERRPILIVEDDDDIRAVLRRALAAQGYRVIATNNGPAAFILARREQPALVVLDLGLPGQDGWRLAHMIRADTTLRHTPILAMMSYGVQPAVDAALAAGCQQVLRKPFALTTIEQAAAALLTQTSTTVGARG